MATNIVIPARLGSMRFAQKILADVNGKPLFWHTHQAALKTKVDRVIIAVDDPFVAELASGFCDHVEMTRLDHQSGTSRLSEVVLALDMPDEDIVINLQADEPLMPPENIHQVINALGQHRDCAIATLCERIHQAAHLFDPHVVKVVRDHQDRALYFSRAPIPWVQGVYPSDILPEQARAYRHLGLYAYRAGFLKSFDQMSNSSLEQQESLEQLRFLQAGFHIAVLDAAAPTPIGVDTEDDLLSIMPML